VQQSFGTPAENVGNFCFWRKDASGPNNNCLNVRPFVGVKLAQTSMDKATADICGLRVTTCPGYEAFSQVNCESTQTPGTGDDALCGFPHPNTPDGYCRQDLSSNFRCTLPCGSDDDCLTGFTCNTSVVPAVCTL
jgi:hypothetical protein